MNAFFFPGQGSQKVGMGRGLFDTSPQARDTFAVANEVLGYRLDEICFEGPPELLTDTRHAQPALLTVGVITLGAARRRGIAASMFAGHSLGEYTALVAAGSLSFEAALRLVRQRARLMAAAPPGAMAALIGLPDEKLGETLRSASREGMVVAANYNSPGQIVVSGEPDGVAAAMREAKARGAKMAVPLPVGGAFHSPLMGAAGEQMAELIDAADFADAAGPVYQNTTARPAMAAAELKSALKSQMTSPVRWTETIQRMVADGAAQGYELGPGGVLAGLAKRIDRSLIVETTESWIA